MRALLFTILVGAVMSEAVTQVDADDKKPHPGKKESYTEKVTVRPKRGDALGNPIKDVSAFFSEVKGKKTLYIMPGGKSVEAPAGTEVTDQKTGDVWTVTKSNFAVGPPQHWFCYVEKKKP